MDPLKAAAATLFCLVLFGLILRLTRRLMEMAIAAGHAEERRRAEDEAAIPASAILASVEPASVDGVTAAPPAHAAGAVP